MLQTFLEPATAETSASYIEGEAQLITDLGITASGSPLRDAGSTSNVRRRMANIQGVLTLYTVPQRRDVDKLVKESIDLLDAVHSTFWRVRRVFGSNVAVELRYEHESTQWDKLALVAIVHVVVDAKLAADLLSKLDDEWLLDLPKHIRDRFMVVVER